MTAYRPRRSVLFAPGDDPRKIQKAAQSAADSVILELEDGVSIDRKAEARETVARALQAVDFGPRERIVRVNAVSTPLFDDDVRAAGHGRADAIMLPKVESARDVGELNARLTMVEHAQGWIEGGIAILAIIETPMGVLNVREIAASSPRVQALVFGAEDFAAALGALRTPAGYEVLVARSMIVLAAAAHTQQAIDQVHVDLNDEAGLEAECRYGRQLGYTGKMVIHPRQLEVVNRCFTPSAAEIAHARRVVAAFDEARARGAGAVALDGRMVDAPVVKQAERVIALAQAAGVLA